MDKKIRPKEAPLEEKYRLKRRKHPNPFADLPALPTRPPDFTPTGRLTEERYREVDWNPTGFLQEDEEKLLVWAIGAGSEALSWTVEERGKFSNKYFDPVVIPTVPHEPWQEKNRPIVPGAREEVRKIVQDRIDSGVYERSSSSYRSNIFPVPKHDGSLRVVHDNQQLNKVSIRDAALPPNPDHIIEEMSGRGIYTTLDLHVAFDQRELAEESRDLTTFNSPYGSLRCTRLLMGHTNSFQILHADMEHIYGDMMAEGKGGPYCDDMSLAGGRSRKQNEDGTYQTIPGNPGIRQFVWDHVEDILKTLWLAKAYGITFSGGKKMKLAREEVTILGHVVSFEGRSPDRQKKEAILGWGACGDATAVRRFLGTAGVLRIFIKNYGKITRPLVDMTRKNIAFHWGEAQQRAMELVKEAIREAPCLAPIHYDSDAEVILGVDSSETGVGWFIAQTQPNGKRRYCRFGSATFTGAQGRYGQSKCELFGLFTALMRARFYLFGVRSLVVEHDARYLKGMVENPDLIPDATINRWIAGIRLFNFIWRHIPGRAHAVADGLSRKGAGEGEEPVNVDYSEQDEFLERVSGYASMVIPSGEREPSQHEAKAEKEVAMIRELLQHPRWRNVVQEMPGKEKQRVLSYVGRFIWEDGTLYRREGRRYGKGLLAVPVKENRNSILRSAHDELGHKGVEAVTATLRTRFWWPGMTNDVRWFVGTCDRCQKRREERPVVQRITPEISGPLRKWHIDTKYMPPSGGSNFLLQARCALTGYPEIRAIATENAKAVEAFIEECLIARYGPCLQIVTDNGGAYLKAMSAINRKWPTITHIRISPYNSQANGIVERAHRTLQESLYKVAGDDTRQWKRHLNAVVMAERLAVRQSIGLSPYFLSHGLHPVLPLDLVEHTIFRTALDHMEDPDEFIACRKEAAEEREAAMAEVARRVGEARAKANSKYNREHAHRTRLYKPRELVLVYDTTRASRHNSKPDDRYAGPYVVIRRTNRGSYKLVRLADASNEVVSVGGRRVKGFRSRNIHEERIDEIFDSLEEEGEEEAEEEEEAETEGEEEGEGNGQED